jgi:hypothetical protein
MMHPNRAVALIAPALLAGCFAGGCAGTSAGATCTKGQAALPHPTMTRGTPCRTITPRCSEFGARRPITQIHPPVWEGTT